MKDIIELINIINNLENWYNELVLNDDKQNKLNSEQLKILFSIMKYCKNHNLLKTANLMKEYIGKYYKVLLSNDRIE